MDDEQKWIYLIAGMSAIDIRAINLNLLPALEALLSTRSVSEAARRLHVTQSAMSHSLAKLRELFADPILVQSGRRMVLTPRAEQLGAMLPSALERLASALAAPEPFDPRTTSRVYRIATLDYFELTAMPDVLAHLRRHAPGVRLELERFSPASLPALAAGEIDLALIGGSAQLPRAGLRRVSLYRDPFEVIVRPDHPAVGRRLSLSTYLELGHVLVSVEGRGEGVVDRELGRIGHARQVALRVPHFVSAPLAVLRSDYICTIASTVARRARELFGVRVVEPPLALPSTEVIAAWSSSRDADPAHAWFRELFTSGRVLSPVSRRLMSEAAPRG